jgi:hypothetical protein
MLDQLKTTIGYWWPVGIATAALVMWGWGISTIFVMSGTVTNGLMTLPPVYPELN